MRNQFTLSVCAADWKFLVDGLTINLTADKAGCRLPATTMARLATTFAIDNGGMMRVVARAAKSLESILLIVVIEALSHLIWKCAEFTQRANSLRSLLISRYAIGQPVSHNPSGRSSG